MLSPKLICLCRVSGHHTRGLVAYPELRLESFGFSIKATHALLKSGSFYGALNHCAVMWDQLAVDEIEFDLVREISVFAIEQLRLIWENFTAPSLPLYRREMSRGALRKDEVMRYERLASAVSSTMRHIVNAGGGNISPRPNNSPRFSSVGHTPVSTPPLTSRKRISSNASLGNGASFAGSNLPANILSAERQDLTHEALTVNLTGEAATAKHDGYSIGILLFMCAFAYTLGMLFCMPSDWSI